MKKIYHTLLEVSKAYAKKTAVVFLFFTTTLLILPFVGSSQQTYTFTNAAATGSIGPSQTQVNTAYLSTNLNGSVTVLPIGIQNWTVPITGGYRIEARGAQGYGTYGGRGAEMIGEFTLTAGTVLKIVVGQQGAPPVSPGTNQYGGGGGSFVTYTNNLPLVIAGGGGGSWSTTLSANADGTITPNGKAGINGTAGAGGTGGNGGSSGNAADGGGGLNTNGGGTAAGLAFVNGATGGGGHGHGGFGGGGGASSWDNRRGCGGGGYSGGGGVDGATTNFPEGGGAGSINNGVNQSNSSGANAGHGRVVIAELCSIKIFSSGSSSVSPAICSGNSLTLTTTAVSNYTWSTGNSTSTVIVVTPTSNTSYSIIGTSSLNCVAVASIPVIVNSGIPILSISNPSSNICLGRTVSLTASGAVTYTWTGGVVNGQTFTPSSTQTYTVTGGNGCGTSTASTSIVVAALPVSAFVTPTIVCEGSPATLSAVSSVSGYTWQPAALYGSTVVVAPLVNTLYTVTASDGTCSGTQTVALTTKVTPTITATTSSTMICQGGSVVLTAGGGASYNWMPGNLSGQTVTVSPSISTLYQLTGTNSVGCYNFASQGVVVSASPTVNIVANKTTVCSGDAVNLFASGANTYVWTGGPSTAGYTINPTSSAVYTVTGTQTGNVCTGTKTIAITAVVSNVSVSSNTSVCAGGSTTLVASGATSYVWNGIPQLGNGNFPVTPNAPTVYTVVATTSSNSINCPVTRTVQVGIFPTPTITIVPTKTLICKAQSNTLTASGAVTYTWGAAGSGSVIVVKPNNTTSYTAVGIDVNGCEGTQQISVAVDACIGFSEFANGFGSISVFPNPSSGEFTIETGSDIVLKLLNGLGQEIQVITLSKTNAYKANVKDLANGVYFLVGENADGKMNQKIVVSK